MSKTILYKQAKTGKIQEWAIWVVESGDSGHPEVWVEHGLQNGKKQTTFDVIDQGVNIGKANETSALEQAKLVAERKIVKQKEEGYKDTIADAQVQQSISLTERFPKELCFYKPKNSIDEKKIAELESSGRLIITVKEDGLMYIVRKSKQFGVEIYSRRMELETEKFPHLVKAFENLPNGTVLLGEIVSTGHASHIEAFKAATTICRSDANEALTKQREVGNVSYKIFDIAFVNGKLALTSYGYVDRHTLAKSYAKQCGSEYVSAIKILDVPHSEAMQYVKDNKIEGLVLWDKYEPMEDGEAYTFNGKAYRPNVLWKSKPKYEDDFIVRYDPANKIGDYGKGKNKGKVGKVFVYQLDDNGNEIWLGRCGGGLTDEQRDLYNDTSKFPRVWRIEYDAIQPGTGALRYPVFNADRTLIGDKELNECLLSEAIKLARLEEDSDDEDESEI